MPALLDEALEWLDRAEQAREVAQFGRDGAEQLYSSPTSTCVRTCRGVSRHFHALAHHLAEVVPEEPEQTVSLRKLLEAKDASVRAVAIPE